MEHLSIEEILNYVSATKINDETLELFSKVNGHIRNCPSCKKKINALELANEELENEFLVESLELDHLDDLIKIENSIVKENIL